MTSLRVLVILLAAAAAALFASHALASPRGARLGGWTPIKDLNDPHVREIAGFAISEHNKQANAALTLSRVVKGEQQTVAGTNYRFVLIAQDGSGGSASYEAVVWEKPWENFRQLTSFKLVQS